MEISQTLNPEQKKAIKHEDGPLLIVAGAGTGKTTVITQRLAWLIQAGRAKSDEILALTFTDKAAGEMEERVDKLLPYGYLDLWISTFHAFCERVLKDHALEIGLPNTFKLLSQTEQWLLVRQNLDKFDLDYYKPLGNPTKFIHELLKHFSRAKDEVISPEDYVKYVEGVQLNLDSAEAVGKGVKIPNPKSQIPNKSQSSKSKSETRASRLELRDSNQEIATQELKRISEVADAYHVYQNLLLENQALDFGDLINYTLQLFQKRPGVLEKYRSRFKYILVDEFQDTNWAQYELLKLLAAPKNNITVVADDDQAIYLWRGASFNNVIRFKNDYPKAEQVVLLENYRSCQEILDLAYDFIQLNNPNRLEAQLDKSAIIKGDAKKKGVDLTKFKRINKKLKSQTKGQATIEHIHVKTFEDEAWAVVNKILELKKQDQDATWNDFAILVRANDTAENFIYALNNAGLPYLFLASRGLYAKAVILDIVNYLKLLDDYHESTAVFRILSLPYWKIPYEDIVALTNFSRRKGLSLYEALNKYQGQAQIGARTQTVVDNFLKNIAKHSRESQDKSVSQIIFSFLEDFNYLKYLQELPEQKSREAFSYLNQFYKEVVQFEQQSPDKSVQAFMQELNYVLESGEQGALTPDWEEGPEAIKVMTIHGAKGLEFKYVFIVSMVDKRFPTIERHDPIDLPADLVKEIMPEGDVHIQEERRLFYVAMTRAKEGLYFTSADNYGGLRKKKLSRFLVETGLAKDVESQKTDDDFISRNSKKVSVSEEDKNIYKNFLPYKFSFTQLKAFATCPYQYRFAHVLKVPVRGKPQFSFGKAIHATLEQFFRLVQERAGSMQKDLFGSSGTTAKSRCRDAKFCVSVDELLEIYEKSWIDDWYSDQEEQKQYKEKGRQALKEFYKLHEQEMPVPKYLEQGFNLRVGDYTLRGVIDRVDEVRPSTSSGPAEVELIDYKTGKVKEEKTFLAEDKEQLLIYQMAVNQVFKEKPVLLSFYYIEGNKKVSFIGSENDLKKQEEKIIKEIDQIKVSQFPPTPSKMKCKYCDFKGICEYRIL